MTKPAQMLRGGEHGRRVVEHASFAPGALPGLLGNPLGAVSGTLLYITLYNGVAVMNKVKEKRGKTKEESDRQQQIVRAQVCSSAMSLKCSNASGLASASMFLTGLPCTTLRTASSTILPLLVRGMSVTWTILAGT